MPSVTYVYILTIYDFLVLSVTECSRNFTALSGWIQTPGFPDKYPNNLECTFIIFAPKMSDIVLEFESFDMEPDITAPAGASCRFDYLEIWDGYPTGTERVPEKTPHP